MSSSITLPEAQRQIDELVEGYPALIPAPMRDALRLTLAELPDAHGMVHPEVFEGFLDGVRRYLRRKLH